MKKQKKGSRLSRRGFIIRTVAGTAGVLAVGVYVFRNPIRRRINTMINTVDSPYLGETDTPLVWFELQADNTVRFFSPKVEMGQGTFTGLAQLAAEELGIRMDQIRIEHAPSASGNLDDFATGGSTSISSLWQPLRELAATMREMIRVEAGKKLGLPHESLRAENGTFRGNGKEITYTEAISGVSEWNIPDTPKLKSRDEFKHIGKPVPRVDLEPKVFGDPIFGYDAEMPEMVYAAVVRPDKINAYFSGADTSDAEKVPGVIQIVREKDFLAVVANSRYAAEAARDKVRANWEMEKVWQTADIKERIRSGGEPFVIQKEGRVEKILRNAEKVYEAEYSSPIGAHAQLEPNGAVAHVTSEGATIKISTQVVKLTRDEVARELDLKPDQVNIIPTYLGGGFGRRLHTPNAVQAALISKAVGKPVCCFFTRKEEFQHDTFRPPTQHKLRASLKEDGMIEALEHEVSSGDVAFGSPMLPGVLETVLGADLGAWRGGMIQYGGIPNYQAISRRVKLPFATSWWRSLGLLANTFAIESFIDELALAAGKNPVEYRLEQIQDDERGSRLKKVIEAAAKKAGYMDEVVEGRAMGFAASTDTNTPCAQVVEVSITDGEIKVHKVTCAIDPGIAVNPDQVRAQCEGSIIMGLSASLYEAMEVVDGSLQPVIYGPYRMALMKDSPKEIEVVILENADKPGAVGEPPLGPIGAAIANAVFRLTGKRLRHMPIQRELDRSGI